MLHILHTINQLHRVRGSTSWLYEAIRHSQSMPVKHSILAVTSEPGDREKEFSALGVRVHHAALDYRFPIPFVVTCSRIMAELKPDIVHAHTSMQCGYELLGARLAGVAHRVAYLHSGEWLFRSGLLGTLMKPWLRALVMTNSTALWGPSQGVLKRWFPKERYGIPLQAVHGGIELRGMPQGREEYRRRLGIAPDAKVIGNIGRFVEQKNHRTIIEVFARVRQRYPDCHLVLLGDGPLQQEMEAKAEELGCREQMHCVGVVKDVPGYLAAMDLFLFPSLFEPLGLVALEAQDAGLPLVASTVAGLAEAVAPEWKKYCRDALDSQGLSEATLALLSRPTRYRPTEFLQYFSASAAAQRLFDSYQGLLHR